MLFVVKKKKKRKKEKKKKNRLQGLKYNIYLAGKGLGYEGQGFYESVSTNLALIVVP